jgi:ElaB/YqjD/DUF883 family membrane-anchored ribosome-binding protein
MTDTKQFHEATDAATQDLAADLAALRADIAKLTASVANLVKAETSAATDSVFGAVGSAGRKFADGAAGAKDRLSGASSELEATIERNPLTAVLVALGAGLIIGLLSRGRQ